MWPDRPQCSPLLWQMKEAMTMQLSELKNELARFGAENDAHETERARRMLNITPDTGEFLSVLVRFGNARRVLEIGTSNGDAGQWLAQAADASIDLLFLDSDREQYAGWWPQLRRVLRRGGLLVVDNATSHAAQMEPLRALLDADQDFGTSLVPVGNGELLAVRNA